MTNFIALVLLLIYQIYPSDLLAMGFIEDDIVLACTLLLGFPEFLIKKGSDLRSITNKLNCFISYKGSKISHHNIEDQKDVLKVMSNDNQSSSKE